MLHFTCDSGTLRVPLGSVKTCALQELEKILGNGTLEEVENQKVGVLQQSVCSSEGIGRMVTCDHSFLPQQFCDVHRIHDGASLVNSMSHQEMGLNVLSV